MTPLTNGDLYNELVSERKETQRLQSDIEKLKYELAQTQKLAETKLEEINKKRVENATEKWSTCSISSGSSVPCFNLTHVKEGISKLCLLDFSGSYSTIANFIYVNILVKDSTLLYRYNSKQKIFEYFNESKKWEKDESADKLISYVFSELYTKCKSLYDKEMEKLEKECFQDQNNKGEKFISKRDELKRNLDIIMNISNSNIKGSTEAYLKGILTHLAKITKWVKA